MSLPFQLYLQGKVITPRIAQLGSAPIALGINTRDDTHGDSISSSSAGGYSDSKSDKIKMIKLINSGMIQTTMNLKSVKTKHISSYSL